MPRIILASQSPRRRQLLGQLGLEDFTILVPDVDESYDPALSPEEIVSSICRRKARAARDMADDGEAIIIAADTMVFLDDARLGKPADEADALRMLTALQGRRHTVCTGVTVRRGDEILTESESTDVYFRPAAEAELRGYIRTGEPMDKAGAYGIQGYGALLVEGIRGDYYNVMGLPVCRLGGLLRELGVDCLALAGQK